MTNAIRSQGTQIQRGAGSVAAPKVISSLVIALIVGIVAGTATATTATAHGLNSGDMVVMSGSVPALYNGTYPITVTSPTTFTYVIPNPPAVAATTVGTYTATTYAYAAVEEAADIKIGGVSVSSIDATHLNSAAKESLAGLLDNGSLDFSTNFTNGPVQQLLRQDMANGTTSAYCMVMGAGANQIHIYFQAYVTKMDGPTAKVDSKMEMQFTCKITGAVTWA
jgi:hypothetical protein